MTFRQGGKWEFLTSVKNTRKAIQRTEAKKEFFISWLRFWKPRQSYGEEVSDIGTDRAKTKFRIRLAVLGFSVGKTDWWRKEVITLFLKE